MASKSRTLEEESGDYEAPDRLMNKEDVAEICNILGLRSSAVNNCEELPEPPRLGAGKVNEFKQSEKLPFLDPKQEAQSTTPTPSRSVPPNRAGSSEEKVPRFDLYNMFIQVQLSSYTFLPPFADFYHHVGKQKRAPLLDNQAIQTSFPNTAASFTMPDVEVKKRSAWAWYRTSTLYLRAANMVETGGATQSALGISTLGSGSTIELRRIVQELRAKADKAKSHAKKLDPKVTQENVNQPSWGISFSTKDQEYYEEMASNYERAQRVSMSERYKGHAMLYLCEAISLYLDWKESNPSMKNKFAPIRSFGLFQSPYFGGAGGIAKLWSEVANWAHHPDTSDWYKRRFREWQIRAVMARAHAEWLVQELKSKYSPDSNLPRRTIEPWRLLPPPPVACYTEDCVIRAVLGIVHPGPRLQIFHTDDPYFTEYTKAQIEGRDFMWTLYGERNFNFGPGAPDFVFLDKAKTGWASDFLGLFPMDNSIMSINTGYYERYCRQGLVDFLPKSSSDYEKSLAICADDIILEWEQQCYISKFSLPGSMGANVLADLEADVLQLVSAREKLTEAEAKRYGFYEILFETIKHHFGRVSDIFSSKELESIEKSALLMFMARAEQLLKPMIQPWHYMRVFISFTNGFPLIALGDMAGNMPLTMEMAREYFTSKMVHVLVAHERLRRIHRTLEQLRATLLKGDRLDEEEWFYLGCFRKYLETGQDTELPFIKTGIERRRETTVSKFRRNNIYECDGTCGCPFDDLEREEIEKEKFRKSSRPQAVQERAKIKRAFAERGEYQISASSELGQVSRKLLRDTFETKYVPLNELAEAREGLSVEAKQLLLNNPRNPPAAATASMHSVKDRKPLPGLGKSSRSNRTETLPFRTREAGESDPSSSTQVMTSAPRNGGATSHRQSALVNHPSSRLDPERTQNPSKPNLVARLFRKFKSKPDMTGE